MILYIVLTICLLSLLLIFEIGTTCRLVSYLLTDNLLVCRLRAQCIISNNNINSGSLRWCVCRYFLQNNVIIIKQLPRPWLFRISKKHHPRNKTKSTLLYTCNISHAGAWRISFHLTPYSWTLPPSYLQLQRVKLDPVHPSAYQLRSVLSAL